MQKLLARKMRVLSYLLLTLSKNEDKYFPYQHWSVFVLNTVCLLSSKVLIKILNSLVLVLVIYLTLFTSLLLNYNVQTKCIKYPYYELQK